MWDDEGAEVKCLVLLTCHPSIVKHRLLLCSRVGIRLA
jgi:hypothetical protein